jgi:hypothetical protein
MLVGRIAARAYYENRHAETRNDASKQVQRVFRGYQVCPQRFVACGGIDTSKPEYAHVDTDQAEASPTNQATHVRMFLCAVVCNDADTYSQDKKLVANMHKEVKKVDKAFFGSRGASENALFRKRNFLATDEDEVTRYFMHSHACVLSSCIDSVLACSRERMSPKEDERSEKQPRRAGLLHLKRQR